MNKEPRFFNDRNILFLAMNMCILIGAFITAALIDVSAKSHAVLLQQSQEIRSDSDPSIVWSTLPSNLGSEFYNKTIYVREPHGVMRNYLSVVQYPKLASSSRSIVERVMSANKEVIAWTHQNDLASSSARCFGRADCVAKISLSYAMYEMSAISEEKWVVHNVFVDDAPYRYLSISPSGKYVSVMVDQTGGQKIIVLDTTNQKIVATKIGGRGQVAWLSDDEFSFVSQRQIFRSKVSTGRDELVVDGAQNRLINAEGVYVDVGPFWSPDQNLLYFTRPASREGTFGPEEINVLLDIKLKKEFNLGTSTDKSFHNGKQFRIINWEPGDVVEYGYVGNVDNNTTEELFEINIASGVSKKKNK